MHFDLPINAFDINTKKREGLTIRRQYHGDGRIDQIMHNIIWAAPLALALALAFAAPLAAQNHDAGRQAFERGDYAAALREFRPLAERGNALAESRLRRIRHRLGITRAAVPPGHECSLFVAGRLPASAWNYAVKRRRFTVSYSPIVRRKAS